MNLNINYYAILGVTNDSDQSKIKKTYYKLSLNCHPDKTSDPDKILIFQSISEAYSILGDDSLKLEYDKKSRYGNNYNELEELFIVNTEFDYESENKKYERFKDNQVLNVLFKLENDDDFTGTIEYNRWVICKSCNGSGKDMKSKIVIKDKDGNVKGVFDSDDGCDFCEGSGKDFRGNECSFCFGKGKIGSTDCKTCKGDRRILGKQKLSNIKLELDKKETIVKAMGNFSKTKPGKVGDLVIIRVNFSD